MAKNVTLIKGNIVFTSSPKKFDIYKDSYISIKGGLVEGIYEKLPEKYLGCAVKDYGHRLLIPGFVDLHTHAPQYNQRGLGMDMQLLEWLREYTFKEERLFEDVEHAARVYEEFADELIKIGTTRVVVFATIHKESTRLLFEILHSKGLGAYVGKVNMDCNCPGFLKEDTEDSLRDTEEIIKSCSHYPLVKPIITPRFAPTSTERLMEGLGELALKYRLPVQSHLSENVDEVRWVNELFPKQVEYHKVYDSYGLFGQNPTLMAHCIHLTDKAIECMRSRGVTAVHCPDSNMNLASGIMPARKLLKAGVKVGLGSDIGAGHDLFMPRSMVKAIQVSKMNYLSDSESNPLTLAEVFYMATKGGGEFFGKVGSFEKGYAFDALVLEDIKNDTEERSILERIQRFIYTGDSTQIAARYVAGREVK